MIVCTEAIKQTETRNSECTIRTIFNKHRTIDILCWCINNKLPTKCQSIVTHGFISYMLLRNNEESWKRKGHTSSSQMLSSLILLLSDRNCWKKTLNQTNPFHYKESDISKIHCYQLENAIFSSFCLPSFVLVIRSIKIVMSVVEIVPVPLN